MLHIDQKSLHTMLNIKWCHPKLMLVIQRQFQKWRMSKRPFEDTVDTGDARQERVTGPLENSKGCTAVATKGAEPSFKNPHFQHSNVVGSKKRPWKTLKQILAAEAALDWPEDAITYSSLEAPPSFLPAKKYSDLSGVEALYTDPHTRLNYACPEEFSELRKLPSDIVQGYLALRKATTQLQ